MALEKTIHKKRQTPPKTQNLAGKPTSQIYGKRGIRTPGTLLGNNSLAGSPIRPLSHLSRSEQEGFEPSEPLSSTVFKTAAFNHSAIAPNVLCILHKIKKKVKPFFRSRRNIWIFIFNICQTVELLCVFGSL